MFFFHERKMHKRNSKGNGLSNLSLIPEQRERIVRSLNDAFQSVGNAFAKAGQHIEQAEQ
jgi:hypothetical protein